MNRIMYFTVLFFSASVVLSHAQDPIQEALQQIERNNTSLTAWHSHVEASKVANRTGVFLSDPQMELYFLNNPEEHLRRTNFQIIQPFDLSTLLGRRNRLSQALNRQLDNQYLQQRQQILLEAHLVVVDLIYHNAMAHELEKRVQHASEIEGSYRAMLEAGEVNILEYNKARINFFNVRKVFELNGIERKSLLAELQTLNGGEPLKVKAEEFPLARVPADFQEWVKGALDANPVIRSAGQELIISRQKENLAKSSYWPGLSAGYMMEVLPGERFAGFGMGFSIPLWENRNTIRQARLKTLAISQYNEDLSLRYLNHYKGLFEQAQALQQASLEYRKALLSFDNTALLLKSLESGQISLIEYMLELGFYYDVVDLWLETERQLHRVLAQMEHLCLL